MENLGAHLKAHREKKGIRLEEIASITKVSISNLVALEAGNWKKLPPEPFVRGFIIAYAQYVGLDPDEIVQRYYEEKGGHENNTAHYQNDTDERPRLDSDEPPDAVIHRVRTNLPWKVAGLALGVVAIGLIVIVARIGQQAGENALDPSVTSALKETPPDNNHLNISDPTVDAVRMITAQNEKIEPAENTSKKEAPKAVKSPPPATESAPVERRTNGPVPPKAVTSSQTNTEPTPASNDPAEEKTHNLVVTASEKTWIKVIVDDEAPFEYFLKEDQKMIHNAAEKIKLIIGNADGAKVTYNGTATNGTKGKGSVRTFIYPSDAKFPQDEAKARNTASKKEKGETPPSEESSPSTENNEESSAEND